MCLAIIVPRLKINSQHDEHKTQHLRIVLFGGLMQSGPPARSAVGVDERVGEHLPHHGDFATQYSNDDERREVFSFAEEGPVQLVRGMVHVTLDQRGVVPH